jgi:hypothetical protein
MKGSYKLHMTMSRTSIFHTINTDNPRSRKQAKKRRIDSFFKIKKS